MAAPNLHQGTFKEPGTHITKKIVNQNQFVIAAQSCFEFYSYTSGSIARKKEEGSDLGSLTASMEKTHQLIGTKGLVWFGLVRQQIPNKWVKGGTKCTRQNCKIEQKETVIVCRKYLRSEGE